MAEEICLYEQALSVNERGWNKIIFFILLDLN